MSTQSLFGGEEAFESTSTPSYERIKAKFEAIKAMGFVKSHRSSSTGIGKTFEDLLEVEENNRKSPDFEHFEVKSKRDLSESYITLFTKSPTFPIRVNRYLREKFGFNHEIHQNVKILIASIFAHRYTVLRNTYNLKMKNDKDNERINIEFYDINEKLIENHVYYSYEDIRKCLNKKLRHLFIVHAEVKKIDGVEHFKYTKATVYLNVKVEHFLNMLDSGNIMFDLRMGVYLTGKLQGKPHDYGSGFRIKRDNIKDLYETEFHLE